MPKSLSWGPGQQICEGMRPPPAVDHELAPGPCANSIGAHRHQNFCGVSRACLNSLWSTLVAASCARSDVRPPSAACPSQSVALWLALAGSLSSTPTTAEAIAANVCHLRLLLLFFFAFVIVLVRKLYASFHGFRVRPTACQEDNTRTTRARSMHILTFSEETRPDAAASPPNPG